MELFRLLKQYLRPYSGLILLVIALQAISSLATLYLPSLNADIIDNGVAKGNVQYIWDTGEIMLAVALAQFVTAAIAVWAGARTAMGVGRDIRQAVFQRVMSFSAEDVGFFGAPSLITRGTNDVQQVQMLVLMTLNIMVTMPIMMVGGIVMALREDAGLSWLVAVSVLVLLVAMVLIMVNLMPLFQKMQLRVDDINGVLREQIAGIRVIRAFEREEFEAQKFDGANSKITDLSLRIGTYFVLMFPLMSAILNAAITAVLWFGAQRVNTGQVEVGSLTAFMQYMMQILAAVMMGAFMAMMLPRAVVCARRIQEVLTRRTSMSDPNAPVSIPQTGTVSFENVSFSYPGAEEAVLNDVSFDAKPGTVTAVIGATGSGKTTLLNLIARLYTPSSGKVLLDGVPVTDFTRPQITERVAMSPQKSYLFGGTVRSNMQLARNQADEAEIEEALRIAQATFVFSHDDGLDMAIAQGGTNVSGGQRQRLCIARSVVSRRRIQLFDDSFSALDMATDAAVRQALRGALKDSTVIIVAQRVSSIMDADQILLLDSGRIIARGTHEELCATSPEYQEIVASQLTEEVMP